MIKCDGDIDLKDKKQNHQELDIYSGRGKSEPRVNFRAKTVGGKCNQFCYKIGHDNDCSQGGSVVNYSQFPNEGGDSCETSRIELRASGGK